MGGYAWVYHSSTGTWKASFIFISTPAVALDVILYRHSETL